MLDAFFDGGSKMSFWSLKYAVAQCIVVGFYMGSIDADIFAKAFDVGHGCKHPNGTGYGHIGSINLIASHCEVVTSRSSDIPHRHHQGLLFFCFHQSIPNNI